FYATFFFQAEDGIRDRNVTGVQTCALPIYDIIHFLLVMHMSAGIEFVKRVHVLFGTFLPQDAVQLHLVDLLLLLLLLIICSAQRSEERRVGKEWSAGWSRYASGERGSDEQS